MSETLRRTQKPGRKPLVALTGATAAGSLAALEGKDAYRPRRRHAVELKIRDPVGEFTAVPRGEDEERTEARPQQPVAETDGDQSQERQYDNNLNGENEEGDNQQHD